MKALILCFILLWLGALPFYAENGNTSTATTDTEKSEKKEIPLRVITTNEEVTYSLFSPAAYIDNNVISVDLGGLSGSFTVSIIRLSSGMDVYTQHCVGGVEIDLSMQESGYYQIEIVSDEQGWQGEFRL
ncbi:DUF3244 domain-containing protein [uncultured Bacteroides sp.]|uniref:DUF3244 domain-containing protein n=1 Tax=uncultured Bacteroides sp. TaxID=162156 RepID=UPI002602EC2C|nr:DUF3244 domain-containing protein [uncultured Bacteroides sp.]